MELTHKDWLDAIHAGDTAKWIIEEDRYGVAHYYREDQADQVRKLPGSGKLTARVERERKARQTYNRKVSPHAKPFVWRLGYNTCVGQWAPGEDYPRFSGSSLNRSRKIKLKKVSTPPDVSPVHLFSKRSRGKVKDKATAFFRAAGGERAFVTLTFIEHVEDRRGVKILNKFLTMLRKEQPGLEYLWVSEHQPERKEKTVHFHMIVNRRMSIRRYNALWVLQQYNEGLTGHTADGQVISQAEVEHRYRYDMTARFKKKDPDSMQAVLNPFSIEKAYNIYGLGKYLTQYITKQPDKDPFGCLNWHCSRRVSKLFTKEVVSPSTFRYMCSFANTRVNMDTGQCWTPDPIVRQFFTIVYVHNKGAPLRILGQLEQVNKWIIEKFLPDKVPVLTDILYKKLLYNERQEVLDTAIDLPQSTARAARRKRRADTSKKIAGGGKGLQDSNTQNN
jgi:hypothetical protein